LILGLGSSCLSFPLILLSLARVDSERGGRPGRVSFCLLFPVEPKRPEV
jgi:hypothetical protein